MKTYKKIMNGVAMVEKLILVLATILIVVLTVGNVLSRKLLHQSWSFTEELVVAVFVLITLMAGQPVTDSGQTVCERTESAADDQHGSECCIYRCTVQIWSG